MAESEKSRSERSKLSKYVPNKIRAEPFKWINFPIFVGIWFVLFWFVICPIVWSKVFIHERSLKPRWPVLWPYYFWGVALLLFCIIMGILVMIWKLFKSKSKGNYNNILLNPQYNDGKEEYCKNCMKFHLPGNDNCKICLKCGNEKESFGKCCEMKNKSYNGPPYNVVMRKQQPTLDDGNCKRYSRHSDKRNSLKNRNSSSSGVLISMHDSKMKGLVNRNIKLEKLQDANTTKIDDTDSNKNLEKKLKKKKPPNLQPVDIELANRETNLKGSSKKEIENVKTATQVNNQCPEQSNTPNYNVTDMDSMNKDSFNKYLHLVEINTPFTPPEQAESSEPSTGEVAKSPLSPREIFFYDLIQAAEKSDSNSPDSVFFGEKYGKKKRPVSHILLTSDVNLDTETDEEKLKKMRSKTLGDKHTKLSDFIKDDANTSPDEKKYTVRVLRTVKKTIVDGETVNTTVVEEKKVFLPKLDANALSEQNSAHDISSMKKESVSRYFISDLNQGPRKPIRMSSHVESIKSSKEGSTSTDDVFPD